MENIYTQLTNEFNDGRLRAVLSSGQAVVVHRLAVMSKDGDWVLREDDEALGHVLAVLESHGARYRFGAPLDVRWMQGGWSSHFEFRDQALRVRTDFVTRPPRLNAQELEDMWQQQAGCDFPVVGKRHLAELKKTNREKDYPVIGELARLLDDPREQMLLSRSARDLVELAKDHPGLLADVSAERPLLESIDNGRDALEAALDAERRELMRANERRLDRYVQAGSEWKAAWPTVSTTINDLALSAAHRVLVESAESTLPTGP